MFVYRSKAQVDAMLAAAGLSQADVATADATNGATKVLALNMAGLRFLYWVTAANGQPGLNVEVPAVDVLLVMTNILAGANAKGTAWPQT